MALYLGYLFFAVAAGVTIFLMVKIKNQEDAKMQAEMNKHPFLILLVAGSWVLGCVIVGHYHMYWYLYVTNAVAAGKFITSLFSGRVWR